ncbi:DUF5723 family protein [Dyadobacter sp. CY327]|uniref:DUF5723 family protein n=1 Tax=Dyadobacter sp. CY327 TaxID=2907301 RepID=UPI001F1843DF|nr:DUF5723 family protein [Dyadobacter sp. CY327]MCE7071017.1 DUF5723 family protein [Dyadobacter sp. CY327]
MKCIQHCLLILLTFIPGLASAQFFSSYSSAGSDPGSALFNPASLHLPYKRWSLNVLSVQGSIGANTASIPVKELAHINGNFLRQNVLGTLDISTGSGVIDVRGPAFAYGVNSKLTVSVGVRTRMHANYWDADGRLISEIGEIVKVPQEYPYTMTRENMTMTAAVFSEINASASYLLFSDKKHLLTGGISVKYINGVAHSSIALPELSGTINRINEYLTSLSTAEGSVETRTAGKLYSDFGVKNLVKFRKPGIGANLGLSYEYITAPNQPYKLRLGIAINDLGRIRYQADSAYSKSYNIQIPKGKGLYFNNNFNNSTFSQTTEVFDRYPEFFERTNRNNQTYSIALPTSLAISADYRINDAFFANAQALVSLQKSNRASKLYNYSGFLLSPRWEKGKAAISLPLSVQEYAGFNAGLNFKLNGFFIGSNSIIGNIIGGSRQLDIFAGFVILP